MALVQTPILSAMWNDIVQRIQMAANLQIRIEARFAPEPRLLTSTGASGAPARSDDCQDAFSRAQRIRQSRSRQCTGLNSTCRTLWPLPLTGTPQDESLVALTANRRCLMPIARRI